MKTTPEVSVIVPVFNGARYLEEALNSILTQSGDVLREILVVNDGSTDESGEIARRWAKSRAQQVSCQCLEQSNGGPGTARNRGLEAASSPFIAFLDADDLWPPGSLEYNLTALERSKASVVLGLTQTFVAPETAMPLDSTRPFLFMNVGAGLYQRTTFEQVGLFSTTLRGSEDVDWFFRVRDAGFVHCSHQTVTLWHRRHGANMTRGQTLADLDFHRALKASLDRRRQKGQAEARAPFEAS